MAAVAGAKNLTEDPEAIYHDKPMELYKEVVTDGKYQVLPDRNGEKTNVCSHLSIFFLYYISTDIYINLYTDLCLSKRS